MTATVPEINFSELSNKPVEVVRKLHESPTRSLLVRRRGDEEDLVLVTASRAADERGVWSVTTSLFIAMLRHAPDRMRVQMLEVLPVAFPWVRFMPAEETEKFGVDLLEVMSAAESLGNPAPVLQLIIAWKHTAEVWADPELLAILTSDLGEPDDPAEQQADDE